MYVCLLGRGNVMRSGDCCVYVCLLQRGHDVRSDGCCVYVCLLSRGYVVRSGDYCVCVCVCGSVKAFRHIVTRTIVANSRRVIIN